MGLVEQVRQAFAADGALPQATTHYVERTGQTDMALAIAQKIEEGGALVVEAGTGVGKTFSYLVPALLSGRRTLLSTATKTLQDQLFGRDLPRLVQALHLPTRVALLKGRSSYLCLHRMQGARQHPVAADRAVLATLAKVEVWAHATLKGDLAELVGLDDRSPVIGLVTSTRENCLGSQCPSARSCHVNAARREAMAADVVVINHHLFFADLAVRESGVAELLPSANLVVFDEAHQLNETGVQFLGTQLSTGQLIDFARDVLAVGLQHARGLGAWQEWAASIERAARNLRMACGPARTATRVGWTEDAPQGIYPGEWTQVLDELQASITDLIRGMQGMASMAPDLERLLARAAQAEQRVQIFRAPCEPESVRWIDLAQQARLVQSPLDIAAAVQERMLGAAEPGESTRTWIFTSATLGTDDALRWFTEPCGLTQATTLRVGSPFDYARQANIYIPDHIVRPSEASHSTEVALLVEQAARRLGGRTMVLTTSLRALRVIGDTLLQRCTAASGLEVLVQGSQPKRQLIERFRQGVAPGQPGCILVASASFWEGVDIAGDALQLVVIDKLPFPPPNEPLVQARSQRLQQAGRSAFNEYHLPEAAVALKQGAGRLIRSESDQGILVVCDQRLVAQGYGRKLMAALPAMTRLHTQADFEQALTRITRTSTRPEAFP